MWVQLGRQEWFAMAAVVNSPWYSFLSPGRVRAWPFIITTNSSLLSCKSLRPVSFSCGLGGDRAGHCAAHQQVHSIVGIMANRLLLC